MKRSTSTSSCTKHNRAQGIALRRLNHLNENGQLPLTLRGRRFTYRGLRTVQRCVTEYFDAGRTRISEVVCMRLGWRQPNGWLKDRACRDVLRQLENLRIIELPPLPPRWAKPHAKNRITSPDLLPGLVEPVTAMPAAIEFELAKGNAAESIWNALVEKYHYLGYRVQVGRCIKYLIRGDGQLLGAISFTSPAWKLAVRDELLQEFGFKASDVRDFVINNSRFLILPMVRVPHLASRILSGATRQVASDWHKYYSIRPLIAETFVEPTRFEGTCYRAANWVEIGRTSGYAKVGASHHNSQPPKVLFVYGLTRLHRRQLAARTTTVPGPVHT